jgi:hypothetical protein
MALSTFFFRATLPATRESLEPLAPLVTEVLAYTGYPEEESIAIAAEIAKAAHTGLAATGNGQVTITFERDPKRLRISLDAPHLSATPPAKGLMDTVTVDKGKSGPTYRYERRVPDAS